MYDIVYYVFVNVDIVYYVSYIYFIVYYVSSFEINCFLRIISCIYEHESQSHDFVRMCYDIATK